MIKVDGRVIEIGAFPDGSIFLREEVSQEQQNVGKIVIEWLYDNDRELVALIYLAAHYRAHGIKELHLSMPYIPNARMDRVKSSQDVFTLKYFSQVINSLSFDSVSVLDPHSSVSEALIDRIVINSPKKYVSKVIDEIEQCDGKKPMMFYPDEGAQKRYSNLVKLPFAFGIKKRDWESGQILGLDVAGDIESIEGNNILIVDDICSKGGTFYHSAMKLKELGAKSIYLYISHCEQSVFEGKLLEGELIKKIYTTNSIYRGNDNKIIVVE